MVSLRQFNLSDIPFLVKYLNNTLVTQYITDAIPKPYTQDDAKWWVSQCQEDNLFKAIEFKGKFVGCISAQLGKFEYYQSAELGYWLGEEHWNKGIATTAVELFSQTLFEQHALVRLFVSVVSTNTASIRVLEKNNFVLEGKLSKASYKNGQYFDELLFAKVIEEK